MSKPGAQGWQAGLDSYPRRLPLVQCLVLLVLGLVIGFEGGRLLEDRHTATAEVLTGTVTWSNEDTRLIAFETDGTVRRPEDGDTFYTVIPDGWQDAGGTIHGDGLYPSCLVSGEETAPLRRRVRLEVVHLDTGGVQREHIAVRVHCLE